jgi:hypothetical protein
MSETRVRQIARLEKLAEPYLKRKRQEEREWQETISGAANHAAVLAFLIRYGNPRLDEPLSRACERCTETAAWKDCCLEFKSILIKSLGPRPFKLHDRSAVSVVGAPLRHFIISTFPGADEKQKLDAVFAAAPPWALWFTFADYTAELLDLTLPDLSKVSRFMRSKENFDIWWGLPTGMFEREPWSHGYERELLARTDLNLLRPTREWPAKGMTPRELMRERAVFKKSDCGECVDSWPPLVPVEFLKLPVKEKISFISRNRDFHHADLARPNPSTRFR